MPANTSSSQDNSVNILCLKWGKRYGPEYVNTLRRMVTRHLHRPFLFHCVTEDPSGLDEGIAIIPFPENPGVQRGWPDILVKLLLLQDGFGGLSGPTLFLDLDIVIMGNIDCFFDFMPGEYCIIHNWVNLRKSLLGKRPAVGNSSVFRFEAGRSQQVVDTFLREIHRAEDRSQFTTEQAFLTYAMQQVNWWPETWVRSFKRHCRPLFPLNMILEPYKPEGCRILVFHGRPDPDEAIRGFQGKKPHHSTKAALWLEPYWQ